MITAILFDVDGTLIDSNDLHASAWRETSCISGVDLPLDRIRTQIGKGGDNLIPALLPPESVEAKQEEIESHRGALFKRDYLPRVVPFPGRTGSVRTYPCGGQANRPGFIGQRG
jgi:phosphoglycolate phosphatase-like HAD superfamily hydrolase